MAIKKKAGRISPVLMGDYDNTTVYRRLDWVKYGGTSYICKKNNTVGIAPSDPERWQKIIDEANLNIPNNWQMTSWNGKGLFEQNGTTWIVTVPTMSQPSDAATAYWGVKLSCDVGYNIRFGIVNGTDDDSAYVNVSSTTDSYYQFSKIGNGNVIKDVKLPKNAWVWMKFQHYSNNTDDAYAYLILEPITIIDEHRTTFEEATTRRNISSSDSLSTILGKIKKYFSDLQTVAFTGKYSDLSDTPTAIKNPNALTFTGAVTGNYDGSTAKSVAIPSVGNGTLTIQKNGTLVKTFTANQSTNVTANITVPTNATDINAVATSKIMTTKEQLSANTDVNNVAGAVAVKNMVSEINSNLTITEYSFTYADGFSDSDEWWTTKAYKCGHIVFVRINCKCSRDISGVETMLYIKSAVHNLFETCNNGSFIVMRDHIEISPGAIISAGSWIRGYVITLI